MCKEQKKPNTKWLEMSWTYPQWKDFSGWGKLRSKVLEPIRVCIKCGHNELSHIDYYPVLVGGFHDTEIAFLCPNCFQLLINFLNEKVPVKVSP